MSDAPPHAARADTGHAADPAQRFAALYPELRRLARNRLRREATVTLLDTTALVHDSFFVLMKQAQLADIDRAAFLAYASKAMRHIIVDYARAKATQRRGQRAEHQCIDDLADVLPAGEAQVLDVHAALKDLARAEPQLALIIEMHYFAGMTEAEVAMALDTSERTVRRKADKARRLLHVLL